MLSIKNVLANGLEDTTDDFISTLLFSEMRKITIPLLKTGDLDLIDEARNNLIQSLSMGLTMYAYINISQYIQKMATRSAILWGYIVSGKLKKKIADLKTKNIKGKKALNMLGAVLGTDKTGERIQVTKIVNDNLLHIDKQINNDKNNRLAIENKMISIGATSSQIKGISTQENFNLFLHKTKTSTWKNTNQDKKLFEKITGETITISSATSWADLVSILNNYSEFAKDTEGRIFNLTEAILKVTNRANLAK